MDQFAQANNLLDAGEGKKALALFEKLADTTGRLDAMHSIAHTYLYGIGGVKQDYDQAFRWFTQAANLGCPQAMYHLGMCNAKGYGTAVHPELAAKWYRQSADYGDEDAMYELGLCYETGFGVKADPAQAQKWYGKAAKLGQEQARAKLDRGPKPV